MCGIASRRRVHRPAAATQVIVHATAKEATVRVGAVIVAIWLVIGLIAAGQRGYFSGSAKDCATAGNTIITVIAGPFNYIGINPKVTCPQPSQ